MARRTGVALLGILAFCSCSSTSEPVTDLSGSWDYSFGTVAADACPGAPPGFRAGCSGLGPLSLTQRDGRISGTLAFHGSCQSCAAVGDSFGSQRTVTGRLVGGDVVLDIDNCHLAATVTRGVVNEVTGPATCNVGTIVTRGDWRMLRHP